MDIFDYNDSATCAKIRNQIRAAQLPIEELKNLIENKANERELLELLKKDLSFLADIFARPMDEYICLPEYHIGDRIVDFIVLTSRSRMEVYLIEAKGANFYTYKDAHYSGMNSHITDAAWQLNNHCRYITQNYNQFRYQLHSAKDSIIAGTYSGNYLLGPKGTLFVDPDKDIHVHNIIIGGRERDELRDSYERTLFEEGHKNLIVYSWESFLRRVDPEHGHYKK